MGARLDRAAESMDRAVEHLHKATKTPAARSTSTSLEISIVHQKEALESLDDLLKSLSSMTGN